MGSVAFLGLGNMGAGMASRLVEAGFDVRVFNRSVANMGPLVALGAQGFDTARAACEGCETVICMVSDDAASQAMWNGPEGALAANLVPNALAIECSTLSHHHVLDLSAKCVARGLTYIDAPVTGLPEAAAAGALTLLTGARDEALNRAKPLFDVLAKQVIHFGPVGAGTVYKLMINMMGAVQNAALAEGMAIAQAAGLDLAQVHEAILTSQAASPQVVRNSARIVRDDHHDPVIFSGALRLKDTVYGVAMAEGLGVQPLLGHVAADCFQALVARGLGEQNESKIVEIFSKN